MADFLARAANALLQLSALLVILWGVSKGGSSTTSTWPMSGSSYWIPPWDINHWGQGATTSVPVNTASSTGGSSTTSTSPMSVTPVDYELFDSESGILTFNVTGGNSELDYVNLFLDGGAEAYKCTPHQYAETIYDDIFAANKTFKCVLPGLDVNTNYNITLQGHDPVDGLTAMSEVFTIHHGSRFNLTCNPDGYDIEFYFGDLQSTKTSVTMATQTTGGNVSDANSTFDDLASIQAFQVNYEMATTVSVFVPPTPIFKGLPAWIMILNDSLRITNVGFSYHFNGIAAPFNGIPGGDPDSDDTDVTMDLNKKPIISVSGSFDNGILTSLQFVQRGIEDGVEMAPSKCYGAGDCSGFTHNQTTYDEYLVGFAGKTNADGHFVELTTQWATISIGKFYVGNESCMVENTEFTVSNGDLDDISTLKFTYSVTAFDTCGTVFSVMNDNHTVVYENTVNRQTSNNSSESTVETFGTGSMKVSRNLGGVGANVRCLYDADGTVTSQFNSKGEEGQEAWDRAEIPFEMHFYTDATFNNRVNSNGLLSVNTGERLYFGVTFKDTLNMILYAHMCYAKKDNDPQIAADRSDALILEEDGCPADDDSFQRLDSVRSSVNDIMDPLSTVAFYWFDNSNAVVYLHCRVRACPFGETDNCTAPASCTNRRSRRDVITDMPYLLLDSHVSSPPIIIHQQLVVTRGEDLALSGYQMWLPMGMFCGVMAALLLVILNAFRKQHNAFLNNRYNLLTNSEE